MLQTLKIRRQAGFTIVELLIVIVVIGILAGLVLNTFSGVQARARNTERQTDIKSIASQLEVFQANPQNANPGNYPLASTIVSPVTTATVQTILIGIDANALQAPGGSGNNLTATATPTTAQYGYLAYQTGGSTLCTTASTCGAYKLYWQEETVGAVTGALQTKVSLNQ